MNSKKIFLSPPHMSGREMAYIQQAFEQNWIAPLGPNVDGFEQDIIKFLGGGHANALSSGTAAIHLALRLLCVNKGDFVFVSTFTFIGSVNPILYMGATPVFIDSEMDTWNMDPNLLQEALKVYKEKGKLPKAVILVHLYGMPAKIKEIKKICSNYNVPLIEDAAEALGSSYGGRKLGLWGDFGVFSFNGNKILSTSGGGALISSSKELWHKALFLSTQARDNALHYEHSEIGYNYRMSNIIAGIGRGQMEVITERVNARREVNKLYRVFLKKQSDIDFQTEIDNELFSNYWLSVFYIKRNNASQICQNIIMALADENIESRPLWKPMHLQPLFKEAPNFINGISEKLFFSGVCLPSGSDLAIEDIERIVSILESQLT